MFIFDLKLIKIMSKNTKLILTFALGAAAGAAIGYLLSSDENKEKLKNAARKVKDTLTDEMEKGKDFIDELKTKAESIINEQTSK